ncbi:hypothetical protein Ccr29_gp340 [Caulobacter phage Ccr29]|nr:hypothetical protein Ccr10_gp004 [Caulobacter phage Ccr10]ARB13857.1 hypothetical protein Ccr10_gp327 [Caulobacter phage Ccr10]ARB14561.1 hypothetical protein Ccr29_gp004 [Caulobacter phage Ccr29]ARB14896.1 hypothetical protein Ccr29_gp340 [Caulobacter phage Ccr29]
MIPDSIMNPRDHFHRLREETARALVEAFAETDPGEDYRAEEKAGAWVVAYYDESGAFVAYL